MKGLAVVRRYAQALYEFAKDADQIKLLEDDIKTLNALFTDIPELRKFCLKPAAPDAHTHTKDFIETAFVPYLNTNTAAAVRLLEKNDRIEALPFLAECLHDLLDKDNEITKVTVTSASDLTETEKKEISSRLESKTGTQVRTVWKVHPPILGGITLQWNNRLLDMSLHGKFHTLKSQLKEKAG